ncbi:pseudouridine synthase [Leptolyngbya sp. O-77]|uniref:pseudouridine synthase n=1 Tax=Leptolyngbya sp. O-77 TaxID=1080068 RepID=UPI00074D3E8A|nr:pseudouridine synthase [Leptolyngbya sp. O-77]BAU42122.1 Ribosomal large subunit pseudouridine synthase D [Leptolyngbya sp. O-77]
MNQGWVYREQVTQRDVGRSLLDYYSQRYPHSSRDEWQSRIAQGQILVNGQCALAEDLLCLGQQLAYHRPPWQEPDVPLEFDILHEDTDVLVVAKPSGLPVLPGGGFLQHTLLGQLQQRYPQNPPTPVHRLGRGTSGLLLLARSPAARSSLSQQMRDQTQQAEILLKSLAESHSHLRSPIHSHLYSGWHTDDVRRTGDLGDRPLQKTYLALIGATDLPNRFTITQPIGKLRHPVLGYVYGAMSDGLPAYSEGQVLQRWGDRTLVEMTILTGRPHQIRIHLATVGYPLLGDPLYLPDGTPRLPNSQTEPAEKLPAPGDCGYCLHAHQLTFLHPTHTQPMTFTVPAPFARR